MSKSKIKAKYPELLRVCEKASRADAKCLFDVIPEIESQRAITKTRQSILRSVLSDIAKNAISWVFYVGEDSVTHRLTEQEQELEKSIAFFGLQSIKPSLAKIKKSKVDTDVTKTLVAILNEMQTLRECLASKSITVAFKMPNIDEISKELSKKTCSTCLRKIGLNSNGKIAAHGFTKENKSGCFGRSYEPLEVSVEGAEAYAEWLAREMQKLAGGEVYAKSEENKKDLIAQYEKELSRISAVIDTWKN